MAVLRWSPRARRELNAALAYIAEDNIEQAATVYQRIDQATAHLRQHPAIGRQGRIPGTRELVIPRTSFIAIYTVQQGIVRIVSLHHASQQWPTTI